MVLKIYLDPCTINSRKVLSGLDLIGIKYDYHYINYFAGGHKDPEFTKINPCQTVPAAVDDDLVLTESNAILQYAADVAGSESYPVDKKRRAEVNRWLFWEASVWFQSCYVYIIENVAKPHLMSAKPDSAALEKEAPNMNKLCGILDAQLGRTKWLAGDEVTIADVSVASSMHLWEESKIPVKKYANLARWYKQMEALPAWSKHQEAVDKGLMPNKGKGVKAELNYTKDVQPQLTEIHFYETEKATGIHEPGDDPQSMQILDGWSRAHDFHMDRNGFSINDFKPSYSADWSDDAKVREEFYPEVVEFLKQETGAKEVLVFDHTIRTKANVKKPLTDEKATSQRAPVRLVHCDYTAESGPKRVTQLLPDRSETLLKSRLAFINVWKPLAKVEENPLCMLDVKSSPDDDFFKLHLRYRDRDGENYVLRHSDEHKWYYFPDMEADKCILLKTYESDPARARFVGHSAFEDPTSAPDAKARESVEIRCIAFW